MALKIQPQEKAIAIQHLSVLASGVATRGQLPSAKVEYAVCLQALRLGKRFNEVIAMVEDNPDLLTASINEAIIKLNALAKQESREDVGEELKKAELVGAK